MPNGFAPGVKKNHLPCTDPINGSTYDVASNVLSLFVHDSRAVDNRIIRIRFFINMDFRTGSKFIKMKHLFT